MITGMKVKEMVKSLQLFRKDTVPEQLTTVWGENRRPQDPLQEYPRPQMVRRNYEILNGTFRYAFTKDCNTPITWDGEILVPFSPECAMSGVNRQLQPDEFLWYEKEFVLDEIPEGNRLLLHFGACDERCRVYINGEKVGFHSGGYLAFSFDITAYIKNGTNILQVCVRDKTDTSYHGRGKQRLKNGGMFYTAQSGLWQTVWYEWVSETYIEKLRITPLYDEDSVQIELSVKGDDAEKKLPCHVSIYEENLVVSEWTQTGAEKMVMAVPNKRSWSPVSPFLYKVIITYGEDRIESYFGMRLFSVEKDMDGIPRLCLNHVPYFQNGILDQGYWPESLLTPPSDEAMIYDITTAKRLGFNMIRKHCKIEPMRWYYHCDRLGMLVWQDMINGGEAYNFVMTSYIPTVFRGLRKMKDTYYGYMSRKNPKGRREWKRECCQTVEQLYNCPCICTWVLFNEGWGQFDAEKNTRMVQRLDQTRFIDAHSGWFNQGAGDVRSEHIYFFDLLVEKSPKPYVISEYGGLTCHVDGHSYSQEAFGYETYGEIKEFAKAYQKMLRKIEGLQREGLCAAVYTQLSDIEEEVNGIMTYDRKVVKVKPR